MSHEGDARRIMQGNRFSTEKVRLSVIWAAKWRQCPTCGAARGMACENMNDRKRGIVSNVKNPHPLRVDWEMLVAKLTSRGYRI